MLYPIVLETEENGAVSAYVPGLPVYAAADSHAKAERAIRAVPLRRAHHRLAPLISASPTLETTLVADQRAWKYESPPTSCTPTAVDRRTRA